MRRSSLQGPATTKGYSIMEGSLMQEETMLQKREGRQPSRSSPDGSKTQRYFQRLIRLAPQAGKESEYKDCLERRMEDFLEGCVDFIKK